MSAWLQRPGLPLFVLLFGFYAYFYQGGGWNQNVRLDLARGITEQGSVVIDAYHENTRDLACRGPDGRCLEADPDLGQHYYCDKAPGVSWLAAPALFAFNLVGGSPSDAASLNRRLYVATLWTVGLLSALAAAFLPGLLARFGIPRRIGVLCALGYGLATLAFPYATLFYGHSVAASLLLIAFALTIRARDESTRAARLQVGAGLLGGAAFAVEYPMAIAVGALATYGVALNRSWRPAIRMALGAAGPILAVAAYHTVAFGGPFTTPYAFSIAPDRARGWMGIGAPQVEAIWALSFGSYRGLFFSSSWLLLAIPGSYYLARRRGARLEVGLCVAVALYFFWMNVSLVDWAGGWTLGPRYLVPALPFLAILAAGGLAWIAEIEGRPLRRVLSAIAGLLGLQSAFFMLVGVAVQPMVPLEIRHPFGDFLLPGFLDGRLALNTLGAHGAIYDPALPRQAWNLGQLLGFGGLWSLTPLFLFAGVAGAWLMLAVSKRDRKRPSLAPNR